MTYLFTSESVAIGHPDKICDQISDAILDASLAQDPYSRVACEVLVTSSTVFIAGEITTHAQIDYTEIARNTIREIGYDDPSLGFDYQSCNVIVSIHEQSPDIALGLTEEKEGAGDQGLIFGYACDDTPELMPLPISLSHKLVRALHDRQSSHQIPFLKPDGKSQVTVEYHDNGTPLRIDTFVLSAQHAEDVDHSTVTSTLKNLILETVPEKYIDDQTQYYINPTGRFVIGGPVGDTGLTGRKTTVDTYGGMGHHGGGAFSGKDPTKVDRSGSYTGRYIAKNIVAAQLAKKCEVQISYAIGVAHPISINTNTFGTGTVPEKEITDAIPKVFDLTPVGMLKMLNLRRPIYKKTAFSGHFGREEPEFTWEKTDRTESLLKFF